MGFSAQNWQKLGTQGERDLGFGVLGQRLSTEGERVLEFEVLLFRIVPGLCGGCGGFFECIAVRSMAMAYALAQQLVSPSSVSLTNSHCCKLLSTNASGAGASVNGLAFCCPYSSRPGNSVRAREGRGVSQSVSRIFLLPCWVADSRIFLYGVGCGRRNDGFIVENGESAAAVAVSTLRTPIACCERACVSIEVL